MHIWHCTDCIQADCERSSSLDSSHKLPETENGHKVIERATSASGADTQSTPNVCGYISHVCNIYELIYPVQSYVTKRKALDSGEGFAEKRQHIDEVCYCGESALSTWATDCW